MTGFEYPVSPHTRRHGPGGYRDYGSYRDWLRDEFIFRCVYCLHREQWNHGAVSFHVEHFIPTSADAEGKCEYSNLLYACAACNEAKQAILGLPNPCQVAFGDCLRPMPNGRIAALNPHGEKLDQVLRLNGSKVVQDRHRWMRILEALRTKEPLLYRECMGFPEDLPDLRSKKAPRNSKPDGALNCYFVLRERGRLPENY